MHSTQISVSLGPYITGHYRVFQDLCHARSRLLKSFIGDQQALALADQIQAALMLAYNHRRVG